MISRFCKTALKELDKHKNSNKEHLLLQHIDERLTKSFNTYQEELDSSVDYLQRRNELNVVKKLNRLL